MQTYTILVREIWVQPVKVKAASLKEAVQRVEDGKGETIESGFEFSHTLEPEFWTAEDSEGHQYNDLSQIETDETGERQ